MAESPQPAAHLTPLLIGRVSRAIFGLAIIYCGAKLWHVNLVAMITSLALALFGLSFVVGGLIANPGCEITALLNVLRPRDRRVHCY